MMRMQGVVLRLLVVVWSWVAVGCAQQRGGELSWMDRRRDFDAQMPIHPSMDAADAGVFVNPWQGETPQFFNEGPQGFDAPNPIVLGPPALAEEDVPAPEPTEPPAISGGTVHSTRNGAFIVIGDSDRDRLWIVDATSFALLHEVPLLPGDEPGRIAEDSNGVVHVVLRGAGAVVSVDPVAGMVIRRRTVCSAPRGIAFDSAIPALRVVCVGGEFVTVPLDDSPNTTQLLERDLRDVVIRDNDIVVSTFRTARVLFFNRQLGAMRVFDANGRFGMPERINTFWRMILRADNSIAISAQSSSSRILQRAPMGYSGDPALNLCFGTVNSFVLILRSPDDPSQAPGLNMLMPVAVDLVDDGVSLWRVSAANQGDNVRGSIDAFAQVSRVNEGCLSERANLPVGYTVTGGARVGNRMVFFSRQPAGLFRSDGRVLWFEGASSVDHVGHRLFHGNFNNHTALACASCHPEGGDDGLLWNISGISFRTPSLRATIAGTAPYHWTGEFASLAALTQDVFTSRMGGPQLSAGHFDRLRAWVESLPRVASAGSSLVEQQAIQRGADVFRSDTAGCASCHSGPRFTNNQTMDVGTGGAFQVPSLVGVRFRPPYMHNGCAATIDARLSDMACGGRAHGGYGLSAQEKSDLAAYLGSI